MELATLRTPRTCFTLSTPTELDHLAATALPSTLSVGPTPSLTKSMLHKRISQLRSMVDYAVSTKMLVE
ncbi:MAG: hypothetical protein MJE68_06235, partial [Proteobacteria bacterium]|nr:hypothetical protein [Pseudomonadota bacterium]